MPSSAQRLLGYIHLRIFGIEVGEQTINFLKHLLWSISGGILASAILMAVNIAAGRLLGTHEYGRYNVVYSLSQILMVIFVFGFDLSGIRSIATSQDEKTKRDNAATTLYACSALIISLSLIGFLIGSFASNFFHITKEIIFATIFFSIFYSFRTILDSLLRGLQKYKIQSLGRVAEAIIVAIGFFFLFYIDSKSDFYSYIIPLIIGATLLCLFYFLQIKDKIGSFRKELLCQQLSYGKYIFLGAILGTIFGSLDKLIIGKYLSLESLGTYSAYYTASFIIASQFGVFFDNVFFTTASKNKDNITSINHRIDRLTIFGFIPAFITMVIIVSCIMLLFGKAYNFSWYLIFLFSLFAVLRLVFGLNATVVTTFSKKALKTTILAGNTVNLFFILLYYLTYRFIGFSTASIVSILILYYLALIAVNKFIIIKNGGYNKSNNI